MTPSIDQLRACGIASEQAETFAAPLGVACERFAIVTPLRLAAFVAQCAHESTMFKRLTEGLSYSHADRIHLIFGSRAGSLEDCEALVGHPEALANRVYAGRYGNGDAASGDGWRYRGAGLIQLTFKSGHERCATALGRDLQGLGDWLRTPEGACLSAAWFWDDKHLNFLADARDIYGITKAINPAMAGYSERQALYTTALAAFGA